MQAIEITTHLNKAFRILRRNYGCPGVDGLNYKTIKDNFIEHKIFLETSLKNMTFKFSEPRKSIIKTGIVTPKVRDIFVYNIYDRWVQETIRIELNNRIYKFIHPHVYSYIRGKNRRQAFEYILNCNPQFILILDIKDFAGSIQLQKLLSMLAKANVPATLIELIYESVKHSRKGLPKGNSITSVLSNFYLSPIDEMFPLNYCRFSDDLIFGLRNESEIEKIINALNPILEELKLSLNKEKVKCVNNNKTLQIIDEYPWII